MHSSWKCVLLSRLLDRGRKLPKTTTASLARCFSLCLTKGKTMKRLLEAYKKLPSPTNRAKLQAYLRKHMMATCLATPEEIAFLRAHQFI